MTRGRRYRRVSALALALALAGCAAGAPLLDPARLTLLERRLAHALAFDFAEGALLRVDAAARRVEIRRHDLDRALEIVALARNGAAALAPLDARALAAARARLERELARLAALVAADYRVAVVDDGAGEVLLLCGPVAHPPPLLDCRGRGLRAAAGEPLAPDEALELLVRAGMDEPAGAMPGEDDGGGPVRLADAGGSEESGERVPPGAEEEPGPDGEPGNDPLPAPDDDFDRPTPAIAGGEIGLEGRQLAYAGDPEGEGAPGWSPGTAGGEVGNGDDPVPAPEVDFGNADRRGDADRRTTPPEWAVPGPGDATGRRTAPEVDLGRAGRQGRGTGAEIGSGEPGSTPGGGFVEIPPDRRGDGGTGGGRTTPPEWAVPGPGDASGRRSAPEVDFGRAGRRGEGGRRSAPEVDFGRAGREHGGTGAETGAEAPLEVRLAAFGRARLEERRALARIRDALEEYRTLAGRSRRTPAEERRLRALAAFLDGAGVRELLGLSRADALPRRQSEIPYADESDSDDDGEG